MGKIVVIGGDGYLGHYVTKYLKGDALSRRTRFDVTDRGCIEQLGEYDIIIHMAALVDKSGKNDAEVFRVNAEGTRNIVESLNENQTLIFASTKEVYTPIDPYGKSKLQAEELIKEYSEKIGFRSGIFRLSTTYAPPTNGSTFVNFFVKAVKEGLPLLLLERGLQKRDFLYVEDLSRAFEKFIYSRARNGVYDIGGGENNSLRIIDLVHSIEGIVKREASIKFSDEKVHGQRDYITNLDKIEKELGWKPVVGINEGLKFII
jgi:nucleoside-diphosphate-sugar epimerase